MSEVPSSSWCTNWEAYNTPRLWSMVAGEDNPEAWKQVIAWREVSDAVDSHLARLTRARDSLASAWPPEQNEASRAFATRLNTLIVRMEGAQEEASSTSMALDNILQALRQAKQNIEPLWKQYRDKNEDVVPEWWDNAEEELDAKARAHMIAAEQVVQQYVPSIKVPGVYELVLLDHREIEGGSTQGGPEPSFTASSSEQSGTRAGIPHDPPPPLPGHASTAWSDPVRSGGPDVTQVSDLTRPNPGESSPPANRPPIPLPPPLGPGLSEVQPGPLPPTLDPAPLSPSGSPQTGNPPPANGILGPSALPLGFGGRAAPLKGSGVGRIMPSGAVIGGMPRTALGADPERGGGRSMRLVAKPAAPSWLPGGASEPTGPGMQGVGRRIDASENDKALKFDPDNPWSVARGVDPVIEPSREVSVHDPGTGVIGQHW